MTDREEKVVKGLECCVRTIEDCECADNCPYEIQCWYGTMYLDLMRDALELLKAQEPAAPVVHANWTSHRTVEHDGEWYCSACGYEPTVFEGMPFCAKCGARMDGGEGS